MSRLEAIAAGLYYPTPEPVVTALARYLHLPTFSASSGTIATTTMLPPRLLDPCAGKGRALALLADTLQAEAHGPARPDQGAAHGAVPGIELYGIEPNAERAQEALDRIPNLLVTSYFTATLSEGGFQLAFVNPPYDEVSEADAGHVTSAGGSRPQRERLELRFLRRTTAKLAPGGILVWIVPQLRLRDAAKHLAEYYADVRCWRFPDAPWRPPNVPHDRPAVPMYAAFSQVVLLARRRRTPIPADGDALRRIEDWAAMGANLPPLPLAEDRDEDEGEPREQEDGHSGEGPGIYWSPRSGEEADAPTYEIPPAIVPLRYFLATTFDPDAVARHLSRQGTGVWGERGYVERHWPDLETTDLGIGRPLAPLRRGHLALLAAAGIANGQELVGTDGRRLVVKGACRKVTTREEARETDPVSGRAITTYTETDHFEVALWAIDLETGEVLHIV